MSTDVSPADAPAGHDPRSDDHLARRVSRGLGWSLLGQVVTRVGVFLCGVVLARLLVPDDFGEVAAAFAVVNVVMAINELGVIPAIVRWTGDVEAAAATATTIAAVTSAGAYLVAFATAPLVATVTNTPGSTWVIRVMALTVLVDGVVAVPLALLYRELRTVPQLLAETFGMVVYVSVAVGLASAGAAAYSIAWARVLGALATAVPMILAAPWPARPAFDRGVARGLLRFGAPLAVSAAVLEAVMNVDYLVVGRQSSGAALGVYLLAFNLSSWPVSIVSTAVGRVSFAGYSALLGDHARLVRGFVHSIAVALAATLPLVVVLLVLAGELVEVVYGDEWAGAVAPLRWLLVIGGLRVLLQLAGELVAVVGRPGAVLRIRLLWLAILPPALVVGARRGGLEGVGVAHVVVAVVVIAPLFVHELRRCGVPLAALAGGAVRPTLASIAALLAMAAVSPFVDDARVRLVVLAAVASAVYTGVLLPANPVVTTVWRQLRGVPVEAT